MSVLTAQITARSLELGGQIARAHGEGAMNALIIVTRKGTYDEVAREYDETGEETLYDNFTTPGAGAMAGVTEARGPVTMDLGDEVQYYSNATFFLPQDGPTKNPRVDDIVYVVHAPEHDIEGRYFRVVDVPVGGRIYASVTLQCVGIAPSRQWQ